MRLKRTGSNPLLVALILVFAAVLTAPAAEKTKVRRFGSVIGVKPEKLEIYKKLHADPWPSVNKALKESHIRNYSIYLTQFDDQKWFLFSYFEYTGEDLDADFKKLSENPEVKRWWKETDPCQLPLKSRKPGDWWKSMKEIYHLD